MLEATQARASILPGLGRARVELLGRKRVTIIGNGALCGALYGPLAMLGVGLTFVDDDVVSPENLANQAFPARSLGEGKAIVRARQAHCLNPDCNVRAIESRVEALGMADLAGTDLLVAAVDNRSARLRIAEMSTRLGVPMLDLATDGSGRWLFGNVTLYAAAEYSPCYACAYDPAKLRDSLADEQPEPCASWRTTARVITPPTLQSAAFAAVLGGVASQWAIAVLLGEGGGLDGRRLFVSIRGGQPRIHSARLTQHAVCVLGHDRFDPLVCADGPTVGATSEHAQRVLGAAVDELMFHRRTLALGLLCPFCRQRADLACLATAVAAADARCPSCGHPERMPVRLQGTVSAGDIAYLAEKTWAELGVPRNDVVTARTVDGRELHLLVNTQVPGRGFVSAASDR